MSTGTSGGGEENLDGAFAVVGELIGERASGSTPALDLRDAAAARAARVPGGRLGAVVVAGGRIVGVHTDAGAAQLPASRFEAAYVAPGFIDLQVNGAFGVEVGDDPTAVRTLATRLPATGVTGFLPTLISGSADGYRRAFAALAEVTDARAGAGASADGSAGADGSSPAPVTAARVLGLHLEGPLLSPGRSGAHERAFIEAATAELLDALANPTSVRMVTLAPERDGAVDLIRRLRARGIVVSVGHTDASAAVVGAAADAGATAVTHLYNAMAPLHHRTPGALAAALVDDRLTALVIADGVHVDPLALRIAVRCKGRRLALATDAMAGAGMPPGNYPLAGRQVVCDGASARLPDGTLAGSTLTMDAAVRNLVRLAGVAPVDALFAASSAPRSLLGLQGGRGFEVGAPADLVLLDDALVVQATFCAGALAHRASGFGPAA